MADASKLKRFKVPPPSIEEARVDLIAELPTPESQAEEAPPPPVFVAPPKPTARLSEREPEIEDYERVDGRTLRKTGRTIPFSTRLNMETDKLIRRIAGKHGILIAEVVERGAKLLQYELDKKQ